jgi:uncharacterized protein (TIGR02145 family)
MKQSRYILTLLALLLANFFICQAQESITLQFTGQDQNGRHVPLSSVLVENVTKHWQEVLYYPDTILIMGTTGIEEIGWSGDGVRLFQNTPNPFDGVTDFALHLPEASTVTLEICDLNGKVATTYQGSLDPGSHLFRTWLASPQTYLLQARTADGSVQIKMVNTGSTGQSRMAYIGKTNTLKAEDADKGSTNQPFSPGDIFLYKGFVLMAGTEYESVHVLHEQFDSELIPLAFTLPLPTVTTEAATNITPTEARLNGYVVENPGYPVSERGFLFANNNQMDGATDFIVGTGGGPFHYEASGLQMGTRYYYRAYARTDLGITYGDILYFDTQSDLPEVHTLMVTDTGNHWADCGGNVTYDGGSAVTARGVCWDTLPNPTVNNSHISNGSGMGSFTSHIFGLFSNTTYYVRAYATNSVGTAYGEERSFTTLSSAISGPFYCGIDSVADYDGNVYPTVEIGYQCWMKENLRTTHFHDGIAIPVGTALSSNVASLYAPMDNSAYVPTYGYLYNWMAIMHGETSSNTNPSCVQGICPEGWHVPSYGELLQLYDWVNNQYVNGNNTSVAKVLAAPNGWQNINTGLTGYMPSTNNASGFSAMPAGSIIINSLSPLSPGMTAYIGSATSGHILEIASDYSIVSASPGYLSVRCLHDNPYLYMNSGQAVAPVVTTLKIDSITSSSASCEGFVVASGGVPIADRGICYNTTPNPTVSDNHISDPGPGTGRLMCKPNNLIPNTTYYIRAYATNSIGTTYGEELVFMTYSPSACGGYTVTDYDGNVYHTLPLGEQCWLRENLRSTHYSDGTTIALGNSSSTTVPYRYAPNGHDSNVPLYGYLYNWAAVMHGDSSSYANPSGVQGICPTGWHVPSKSELEQFVSYIGNQPQNVCGGDSSNIAKALASDINWAYSTNACAPGGEQRYTNNVTGFSALPAGYYNSSCDCFSGFTGYSVFWSSSSIPNSTDNLAYYLCLQRDHSYVTISKYPFNTAAAYSVRCLRD